MNPTGNIPIIEMPDGMILTQSYAILRHWGRMLNAYEGKTRTEDEKYWADAMCDIVIDCERLILLK
jgi:glutathione S-transferase